MKQSGIEIVSILYVPSSNMISVNYKLYDWINIITKNNKNELKQCIISDQLFLECNAYSNDLEIKVIDYLEKIHYKNMISSVYFEERK